MYGLLSFAKKNCLKHHSMFEVLKGVQLSMINIS